MHSAGARRPFPNDIRLAMREMMVRLQKAVERHRKITMQALPRRVLASRLFSLIEDAQRKSFTTQM
jgi:hypothetical protein